MKYLRLVLVLFVVAMLTFAFGLRGVTYADEGRDGTDDTSELTDDDADDDSDDDSDDVDESDDDDSDDVDNSGSGSLNSGPGNFRSFEERQDRVQDRLEERSENVTEHLADRLERVRERLGRLTDRICGRMGAAEERLSNVAGRIQSRIDKFEERGADMSEAQALLDEAEAMIEAAGTHLDEVCLDAVEQIESAENLDELIAALGAIRADFASVKDELKAAHAKLVDAINSMKPGLNDLGENDENGDGDGDE